VYRKFKLNVYLDAILAVSSIVSFLSLILNISKIMGLNPWIGSIAILMNLVFIWYLVFRLKECEKYLELSLILFGIKKTDEKLIVKAPLPSPLIKEKMLVEIFTKSHDVEQKLGEGVISYIQTDGVTLHIIPLQKEILRTIKDNFFAVPKFVEVNNEKLS